MKTQTCLLGIALLFVPGVQAAVVVQECKDPAGDTYFAERCPPGSVKIGERRLLGSGGGSGSADSGAAAPAPDTRTAASATVVLYTVPRCDACDVLRAALESRDVPYTEKDASGDPAVQAELQALAGSVTVPALTVGETLLTGYNQTALDQALKQAGFPTAPADDDTAPPESGGAP